MALKQFVQVFSTHDSGLDVGSVYFSQRTAAKGMKIYLNAVQKRIKRGTIEFVRVNDKEFLPDWAVAFYRSKGKPISGWRVEYPGFCAHVWREASLIRIIKNLDVPATITPVRISKKDLYLEEYWPKLPTTKVPEFLVDDVHYVYSRPIDGDKRKVIGSVEGSELLFITDPPHITEEQWEEGKKLFLEQADDKDIDGAKAFLLFFKNFRENYCAIREGKDLDICFPVEGL